MSLSIMLKDIFGLHLFTGSGNRRVYTDSERVLIGICGRCGKQQPSGTKNLWWPSVLYLSYIILRDIFGPHLFTGKGNREVYTDS